MEFNKVSQEDKIKLVDGLLSYCRGRNDIETDDDLYQLSKVLGATDVYEFLTNNLKEKLAE